MEGYLGTTDVTDKWPMTPAKAATIIIGMYGGIDGAHHKDWVLDQVTRILMNAPVTIEEARWENGETELRYSVGTSDEYEEWVRQLKDGEDGPDTYDYSTGIAP
jgi:hypothetical protein